MKRRLFAALVVVVCLSVLPVHAGQRDFVVTTFPTADSIGPVLHRAVFISGTLVPIGEIGYDVSAISFDGEGRLFGIDPIQDALVQIDPSTGAGSLIGPLGIDLDDLTMGLAFDRNERLWMSGYSFGSGHGLYEINPSTGSARFVGSLSELATGGLAEVGDAMFGVGYELTRIDTATAEHKPVGEEQRSTFLSLGMDKDAEGRLWSVRLCTACASATEDISIAAVNPKSGEQRAVGLTLPPGARGLAIRPGTGRIGTPLQRQPSRDR